MNFLHFHTFREFYSTFYYDINNLFISNVIIKSYLLITFLKKNV